MDAPGLSCQALAGIDRDRVVMADVRDSSNCGDNQDVALPGFIRSDCLCVMAGHHLRATDPHQLAHSLGWDPAAALDESQLLLGARHLSLEVKPLRSSWEGLARIRPDAEDRNATAVTSKSAPGPLQRTPIKLAMLPTRAAAARYQISR